MEHISRSETNHILAQNMTEKLFDNAGNQGNNFEFQDELFRIPAQNYTL